MARSEDGEFELILGNKQLLSVFFIVVVLLGVFFTMGYIVGKNSVPPDVLAAKREPIVVDPAGPPAKDLPPGVVVDPRSSQPEVAKPSALTPQAMTEESRAPERKAEAKPEAKQEPPQKRAPTAVPPTPAEGTPPVKPPSITTAGDPAPGQQFLQVVASTRPDCEIIVDVLKRKGFPAVVAPGPSVGTFRVLVGPLPDTGAITRTRAELEAAGFQKPYLRKY
ncbi:MAG TPA: hypothetical protein VM120_04240 [Bryobacteraceae bacterium]|nr:hypothetical protein [Bryobacteraceae bacterium]